MNNTQFCKLDNNQLAYHRCGKGEPMLLVHGITTYSFIWQKMIPALSEKYDVISLDLLGCGESDKPFGADLSIAVLAQLIRKFIDKLSIGKLHLVCHDIGGGIGQLMAIDHSDVLSSLTLINSVGYDFWPVQPITSLRIPILREFGMASLNFGMFEAIIRRGLYHRDRLDHDLAEQFRKPLRTKEGRHGFLQLAKCIDNRLLTDRLDELRKVVLPTTIVRGVADVYLSSDISEKLHRDISDSKLVKIATAGHYAQIDEPDQLSRLIIEFVEKNPID